MSAIGPGDWVECIRAPAFHPLVCTLQLGAAYQVRDTFAGSIRGEIKPSLRLVGIANPIAKTGNEWGYLAERFRPIYRPKSELLETLLRKSTTPAREDA